MMKFGDKPVYLACGATDMRKQIDGLAAKVQADFKLNPFDKALFVFCNRARNKIKVLEWDGDGYWLYFKRLERGTFRWPAVDDGKPMELTSEEFEVLIGSARLTQKLRRQEITSGKLF